MARGGVVGRVVRLGERESLGNRQWNFGEGNGREWTVAFGGWGSKESNGKLLRLCWL